MASSFIAKGRVDQYEIGRWSKRRDLAGRGDADQQAAPRREKLLGEQHGERGADRTANDAKRLAIQFELVKDGMIAGPA